MKNIDFKTPPSVGSLKNIFSKYIILNAGCSGKNTFLKFHEKYMTCSISDFFKSLVYWFLEEKYSFKIHILLDLKEICLIIIHFLFRIFTQLPFDKPHLLITQTILALVINLIPFSKFSLSNIP